MDEARPSSYACVRDPKLSGIATTGDEPGMPPKPDRCRGEAMPRPRSFMPRQFLGGSTDGVGSIGRAFAIASP